MELGTIISGTGAVPTHTFILKHLKRTRHGHKKETDKPQHCGLFPSCVHVECAT